MKIELSSNLAAYRAKIDEYLGVLVSEEQHAYKELFEAARYSLLAPGKRLRPVLCLSICDTFNEPLERALDVACAIEMIHAYSLIHDDLPCMDDDDERRGRPTLHKVFPEWGALLAGDYLLTKSFEVIADAKLLSDREKIQITKILSTRAGGDGMIGGQYLDLLMENEKGSLENLQLTHRLKTGALILSACESAAVICKLPDQQRSLLSSFGEKIGLAFQIQDDILDVTGDAALLGKAPGSDVKQNKSTYVSLLGLEKAKKQAEELMHSALEDVQALTTKNSQLEELALYFVKREL